jgi:hypothetical protein
MRTEEPAMPQVVDIKCPQCNAPQSGQASPAGLAQCPFCGHKYHLMPTMSPFVTPVRRSPGEHPAPPPQTGPRRLLAGVGLVVLACALFGVLFYFRVYNRQSSHRARSSISPRIPRASIPSISSTPQPAPPEVKPTAEFTHHRTVRSLSNTQYVYGMVKNTCSITLGKPKITAVLRDASGKELDTRSGYAERELLPGESAPVQILLTNAPAFASMTFEVEARKAFVEPHRAEKLKLEPRPPERSSFGGWVFKGKVHNEGSAPARFVRILVLALDSDGKICGTTFTYAHGQQLAPGESARYEALTVFSAPPARFELSVEGRPVE